MKSFVLALFVMVSTFESAAIANNDYHHRGQIQSMEFKPDNGKNFDSDEFLSGTLGIAREIVEVKLRVRGERRSTAQLYIDGQRVDGERSLDTDTHTQTWDSRNGLPRHGNKVLIKFGKVDPRVFEMTVYYREPVHVRTETVTKEVIVKVPTNPVFENLSLLLHYLDDVASRVRGTPYAAWARSYKLQVENLMAHYEASGSPSLAFSEQLKDVIDGLDCPEGREMLEEIRDETSVGPQVREIKRVMAYLRETTKFFFPRCSPSTLTKISFLMTKGRSQMKRYMPSRPVGYENIETTTTTVVTSGPATSPTPAPEYQEQDR